MTVISLFSCISGVVYRSQLACAIGRFSWRVSEAEEIPNRNMGARKQYSSITFHGGLTEGISLIEEKKFKRQSSPVGPPR